MKKKTCYIAFFGFLFFVIFLRLFRLATTPLRMHIDEAGLGLNAWSIANFGTDRYGNFLPVCPTNFYGEQSAFYTYFCALLVKLFGLNIYTLRLPGVIMGVVAVLFGSLILKEKCDHFPYLFALHKKNVYFLTKIFYVFLNNYQLFLYQHFLNLILVKNYVILPHMSP